MARRRRMLRDRDGTVPDLRKRLGAGFGLRWAGRKTLAVASFASARNAHAVRGLRDLSLSFRDLVAGRHRTVWRNKDMPCLMERFLSSAPGRFRIEVNIRANR